ncbi:MAG: TRAM domain-containing protein [Clostridia bacterium]|nr:TRAM domain-containing protein [Clostridia bacterium]
MKRIVKRWLRLLTVLIGGAVGAGVGVLFDRGWLALTAIGRVRPLDPVIAIGIVAALTFLGLILSYLFASPIIDSVTALVGRMERYLNATPMAQVFVGALGLIVGLAIAALITQMFNTVGSPLFWMLSVVVYLVMGYLGVAVSTKRWREFPLLSLSRRGERLRERPASPTGTGVPKILDTSVIIDGRIFDICKTGFVEGPLVVSQFVLAELRHIADSSDVLRRNRGRRGLDVLQRLQKELEIPFVVEETEFEETDEVDVKLLKLAKQTGGIVVTNDYNLNKVAAVTGVRVLNINELANAVRPVVLHGEEMIVQVVREGKEPGQGVGYLEDGTMIVVDNGRRCIGESIEVVVTTVLQTAAGRMIFTKIKQADKVG